MFVIDFEQVNAPREAFNVTTIRHLNAQSKKKTLGESVRYFQGRIIQRKILGGIPRRKIFRSGGVTVQRGTI